MTTEPWNDSATELRSQGMAFERIAKTLGVGVYEVRKFFGCPLGGQRTPHKAINFRQITQPIRKAKNVTARKGPIAGVVNEQIMSLAKMFASGEITREELSLRLHCGTSR